MDEIKQLLKEIYKDRKEYFYTNQNIGEVAYNNCENLIYIIELLIKEIEELKNK